MQTENIFPYFTEIEETFVRRRGRNLLISSKDWALIDGWKKRDIPLHIAIRAIEQVFDTKTGVTSLAYCAPAVEREFEEWQTSQVGASVQTESHECGTCFDLGVVYRPKPNSQFTFEMEEIPCPSCTKA